jgi:hypothetical protein
MGRTAAESRTGAGKIEPTLSQISRACMAAESQQSRWPFLERMLEAISSHFAAMSSHISKQNKGKRLKLKLFCPKRSHRSCYVSTQPQPNGLVSGASKEFCKKKKTHTHTASVIQPAKKEFDVQKMFYVLVR